MHGGRLTMEYIQAMQEKNAKLREQGERLFDKTLELATENVKLREQAGALLASHEKMCTQRGHCFGCTFFYEEVKACPFVTISRTLRELGIEVD